MENNKNKKTLSPEEERIMQERMLERRQQRAQQKKAAEEKKEKRQHKTAKLRSFAIAFLAVIVVLSLLFVAARSLGNVTFSKAADYISQSISNLKPGDGYPVELGTGTVQNIKSLGDCIAILRDDSVLLLNSTAKELNDYSHSYSKPVISVSSGRMLVTDRTTGRYFIADSSDILHEAELHTEVYCAQAGVKGNYAFSCADDDASSVLKVCNSKFETQFSFKCSKEYIIGISLSANGKYLAAIGIGSEKAAVYSKLYLIDINEQQVINEFDFKGETLSRVFYSGNNSVIAVSENAYYIVEKNSELEKIGFDNNTISSFVTHENGNFALVLSKYGSIDSGLVAVFDSKGKENFTIQLNSGIDCIDYDGKNISFVDSSNILYSYNSNGKLIGKTQLDNSAQKLAVNGKYCYTLCYGDLLRMNVRTNLNEEK
ncbi:MAG: hypothetical protein IKK85_03255 [Clostridia bacterium]|nr:hypothetical protein [Clostridia bacterium]